MIILTQIQKNLAQAIRQSGMTQTAIGKALGISQKTVSRYVNGHAMPPLDIVANLCILLDLNANDILCIEETIQKMNHQTKEAVGCNHSPPPASPAVNGRG